MQRSVLLQVQLLVAFSLLPKIDGPGLSARGNLKSSANWASQSSLVPSRVDSSCGWGWLAGWCFSITLCSAVPVKLLFKQSFLQVVQNIQHKKQQQSVLRLCLHLHALQAELILPKVLPRADESHTWEMLSLWRRKLSLSLSKSKGGFELFLTFTTNPSVEVFAFVFRGIQ